MECIDLSSTLTSHGPIQNVRDWFATFNVFLEMLHKNAVGFTLNFISTFAKTSADWKNYTTFFH